MNSVATEKTDSRTAHIMISLWLQGPMEKSVLQESNGYWQLEEGQHPQSERTARDCQDSNKHTVTPSFPPSISCSFNVFHEL